MRLGLFGRRDNPDLIGVNFAGSQSYCGAVASGAVRTARVRFRLDTMPGAALKIIAGSNDGNDTTGWLVCTEDADGGAVNGQLVVYVGIGGVITEVSRSYMMPADIGRVFVLHVVCDGTKVWVYLDGKRLGPGVTCAAIGTAAGPMNIGGKSDGTFSSDATVFDVAEGTEALSRARVAVDAAETRPRFTGQTHRYVATFSVADTWLDEVGTADLTVFGSPVVASIFPAWGNHRGVLEIWGDSIAAGAEVAGVGNGWRREMQRELSEAHLKRVTLRGENDAAVATLDFDRYHTALGGESLFGRLPTMVADLNVYAPADSATLLAYGTNDLVAEGRTAVQLQADVVTACGYINAARPGKAIFVCSLIPRATAVGAAQRTLYQDGFDAFILTLQETYPQVVGINYFDLFTGTGVDNLYDGIHPTPDRYATMGRFIAPIISAHV